MQIIKGLRYVSRMDWGWFAAYMLTGLVFPLTLLLNPPASVRLGTVSAIAVNALLGLMIFGSTLAIAGILIRGTLTRPLIIGYALEVGGGISLIAGPILLAIVYGVHAAITGGAGTGPAICIALASPFVARLIDVLFLHLAPKAVSPVTTGEDDATTEGE